MKLTLAEYDLMIGRHLQFIREGSEMVRRHVDQMKFRPDFDTLAFDAIEQTEVALERALARLREAKIIYLGRPTNAEAGPQQP